MLQESVWKTRELIGARINVGGRVWGGLALHRAAKFACQHKSWQQHQAVPFSTSAGFCHFEAYLEINCICCVEASDTLVK